MEPSIIRPEPSEEYHLDEDCYILESWNRSVDPAISIARARVEPGIKTRPHYLEGVIERYLIFSGQGEVHVGDLEAECVGPGDVVVIPAGVCQSIRNTGDRDLVFYAICTPRFTRACYHSDDVA